METELTLSEKMYLLAIHPQKGGIIWAARNQMKQVICGALMLEVALSKKIRFDGKKVIFMDSESANPAQKIILGKIATSTTPRKAATWLSRILWKYGTIKKLLLQSLLQKRLIRIEDKQFLFFKWKKVFLFNNTRFSGFVGEVETMIFKGTEIEEEQYLLSLLPPSGSLSRIFPEREKRKLASKQLKKLAFENVVSKAVVASIRAARAAAVS